MMMNDTPTNYETISNYCLDKASSFDNNNEQHCNKSSLQALQVINKSNSFSSSSSSSATTVPSKRKIFDNKYVSSSSFVDKENAGPNFKAANNSKKKKILGLGGDGKPPIKKDNTTRQTLATKNKEEQITALQTQLKQTSTALTKVQTISMSKDNELNELSFKLDRQIDETNLYKVMADQTGLFELLNNQDTLIESLMRLIGEKDQALDDAIQYNSQNNKANKKLLLHAESKHTDELQIVTNEHNEQLDTLHTILSLQLREKYMFEKQIMLIKEQLEEGSEESKQFVYEVKFMLVLMSMLSVLVSQRMEYFVYVSPLYFLFIFFTLE